MRRNWSQWTVGLIILIAAVYFFQDPEWNGNSRLNLTRAIVEQGSFQIDKYVNQHDWITEDVALFEGHYYSDKAIGSSFLAVPFYFLIYNFANALHLQLGSALIKHLLTALVLGPGLALNGMVMYRLAGKLGASPARALTVTLAVALGTMLWPYSAVFYGHVLAATFLILAFYLLFSMRQTPEAISPARCAGVGAAIGLAFITEYTTALIIAGLIIYALYVLRRQSIGAILKLGIAAALGALIPLAFMFAYNFSVYGNPVAMGYTYEASDTFQEGMSLGLMGIHRPRLSVLYHITFDSRFGLFWASPVLLLTTIGYVLPFIRREHRAEALLSAYAVAIMLIMNAGYYLWWGGYAFGPRLIIPALSFFVVPLAMLPAILDIPAMLLAAHLHRANADPADGPGADSVGLQRAI